MPPTQRIDATGVIGRLLATPQQFGFFQAVRLLDRWLDVEHPNGRGIDRIHFRNSTSLSFPASEIEALSLHVEFGRHESAASALVSPTQVDRVTLTPAFMGLLGVSGTLPTFYTEAISQRELYQKDHGPRAFMDFFSHRAVHLFYGAWKKFQLGVRFESDRTDAFMPMVLALGGVADQLDRRPRRAQSTRRAIPAEALAYYAGALQHRTWSVAQVQALLQDYFQVPVAIEQFVGRWYDLPQDARFRLGVSEAHGRGLGVLGATAMLGERVWQRDLCMRVVLGPIPDARMKQFLPGSRGEKALQQWLTLCFGTTQTLEINLRLQGQHVKPVCLDSMRDPSRSRLGWDTFLQTRAHHIDRTEVRYELQAAAWLASGSSPVHS